MDGLRGIFTFLEFSEILLAEADPFAQCLWEEEEASGISQRPRQGSVTFDFTCVTSLIVHNNLVTPGLLLLLF